MLQPQAFKVSARGKAFSSRKLDLGKPKQRIFGAHVARKFRNEPNVVTPRSLHIFREARPPEKPVRLLR